MAFKLSKDQSSDWDIHITKVKDALKEVTDAVQAFNAAMKAARGTLQEMAEEYNTAVSEAKDFVNGIGEEWRAEFDEKSEAWQEGDKGQEVIGLIEAMENYSPEEFSFNDIEELEEPSEADALEDLEGAKPEE